MASSPRSDIRSSTGTTTSEPPEAWAPARRAARRLLAPVEWFFAIEASSGILLLLAAVVALGWANSPWRGAYEALWHTPIGLRLGPWGFERDLHFWINDGLMTVFFFVVGLEIRREIHAGELSEPRRAALPLAAAVGGMLAPAVIYVAFNVGRPAIAGWGVPMATDIAFAVGVLALLGRRVPPALRILLLALAVIDDVGAILVIAIFYSSGFALGGFAVMAGGLGLVLLQQKLGVRSPWAYVPAGVAVWAGCYAAGIHPTLAGVVVGLLTPVRAWYGPDRLAGVLSTRLQALAEQGHLPDGAGAAPHDEKHLLPHLGAIEVAGREALAPVERLQHALHGLVAFAIMPLFALANAGVSLGNAQVAGEGMLVFGGVALGLAVGKPLGILGLSWLATRLGLAALPRGVRWVDVLVVGMVAGIGFTMALFIAQLAFPAGGLLETAKLAILCASAVAGGAGYLAGRLILRSGPLPDAARTAAEAEASTVV